VHSDAPWRLAEVAVIGSPKLSTTARGMAASGTRKATLPVLAVERSGSLQPAFTMMVSGPGQKRRASRWKRLLSSPTRSSAMMRSLTRMGRKTTITSRAISFAVGQGDPSRELRRYHHEPTKVAPR